MDYEKIRRGVRLLYGLDRAPPHVPPRIVPRMPKAVQADDAQPSDPPPLDAPPDSKPKPRNRRSKQDITARILKACIEKTHHPDATDKDIAKRCGLTGSQLSKDETYSTGSAAE